MKIDALKYEMTAPRELHLVSQVLNQSELASTEILCRTLISAISPGTEIGAYIGSRPLRPIKAYPRVNGYLNVGEVVAVGDAVTGYKIGDRVLTFSCHCSAFKISEKDILFKLEKDDDINKSVLTYLYHLPYDCLLKTNFVPGMSVGVIGLGVLGLAGINLISAIGGRPYGFSNYQDSHRLAKTLGAIGCYNKDDRDAISRLSSDAPNGVIDIVSLTTNSWDDWKLALELPRKFGKIGVIGFPGRTSGNPDFNPLDSHSFHTKQLQIIACGMSPEYDLPAPDMRFTVKRNCIYLHQLIRENKLSPEALVAGVRPARDLKNIYEEISSANRSTQLTYILDWKNL